MMARTALVLAAAVLLGGCVGTPVPKLAKCSGPYRYANPNGTVLPSLPVPGQNPPTHATGGQPPSPTPEPLAPGAAGPDRKAPPPATQTSGLQPPYPSC